MKPIPRFSGFFTAVYSAALLLLADLTAKSFVAIERTFPRLVFWMTARQVACRLAVHIQKRDDLLPLPATLPLLEALALLVTIPSS